MNDLVTVSEIDDEAAMAPVAEPVASANDLPAGLSENDDGTYTLRLARPLAIQFKSADGATREERFEALKVRRLTGRDMKAMMVSDRKDGSMALFEACLAVKPGRAAMITDRMDAVDLMAGLKVVAFLSGSGLTTGR